jgi:putative transposase
MPINEKYLASFEESKFYHIYSKAVGEDLLFRTDENMRFFLQKYSTYTSNYFDTYSYNLLDNHFHLLIKCVSEDTLVSSLAKYDFGSLKKHQQNFLLKKINYDQELEFQFKDLLISYSQAFNKLFSRSGPLFANPFRRILVKDEAHFTNLIIYIHANTLKHKIFQNFQNYKWSSYQSIISNSVSLLKRTEVLDWFGGRENFIKTHQENSNFYYDNPYGIE